MKFFKVMTNFAKVAIARQRLPFYAYVLVTDICNLKCSYCFTESPARRSQLKTLSISQVKEIIDELYKLGTRMLALSGGEPMLRDDIGEIVDYADGKGMYVMLYTNGTLIHKNIRALTKVDQLLISVEGKRQIHDLERGRGTYDLVLKNIFLLEKIRKPYFIVYSATRNNMFHLGSFLEEVKREHMLKPHLVVAECLFKETKKIPGKESIYPTMEELKHFWIEVRQLKLAGHPIVMSLRQMDLLIDSCASPNYIDLLSIYHDSNAIPEKFRFYAPCCWGRYGIFVDTTGLMYPCPKLFGTGSRARNIFEVGFKEAYRYISQDAGCVMCRCTINSAMNNLLNANFDSVINTILEATKFSAKRLRWRFAR